MNKIKNKDFKKLIEEIEPFIKPKKYVRYSTAGKWTLTKLLEDEGKCIISKNLKYQKEEENLNE